MIAPATAVWLVVGVALVALLVTPPSSSGESLGIRRFHTAPISTKYTVSQRFRAHAARLNRIDVRPVVVGDPRGTIVVALHDLDTSTPIAVREVGAAAFAAMSVYRVDFSPVADSRGHAFELDFSSSVHDPSGGVALWATKRTPAEGEALAVNGVPRWAVLAFQTHSATRSHLWELVHAPGVSDRPPKWLALAGFGISWLLIGVVLQHLSGRAAADADDVLQGDDQSCGGSARGQNDPS